VKRGVVPDVLTDQTARMTRSTAMCRTECSWRTRSRCGEESDEYIERAMQSMAVHVEAMLALQKKARSRLITQQHSRAGAESRC